MLIWKPECKYALVDSLVCLVYRTSSQQFLIFTRITVLCLQSIYLNIHSYSGKYWGLPPPSHTFIQQNQKSHLQNKNCFSLKLFVLQWCRSGMWWPVPHNQGEEGETRQRHKGQMKDSRARGFLSTKGEEPLCSSQWFLLSQGIKFLYWQGLQGDISTPTAD